MKYGSIGSSNWLNELRESRPFIEVQSENYYVPAQSNNFWDATSGAEYNWDVSLLKQSGGSPVIGSSKFISIDETTEPTQTRIVAKKRIEINVTFEGNPVNAGAAAMMIFASNGDKIGHHAQSEQYSMQVTTTIILNVGDYIYGGQNAGGLVNRFGSVSITAKEAFSLKEV